MKLIIVLFACILANVEAGIFIKAKQPNILQDSVWLYSNASAITSVAQDVPGNKFSSKVYPFKHVPEPHENDVVGILYNRDDSCTPDIKQDIPYPFYSSDPKSTLVPKIALVKKEGNCTITRKILNAQADGAIGVIIYNNEDIKDTHEKADGVQPESGIKIPAYYVDHNVGEELIFQLKKMAGVPTAKIATSDNSNLTTRISVRVALMPADDVKPTAWELTLLVVLVILGTSIIFSVITHIYLWKRSQRLHQSVERSRGQGAGRPATGKMVISYTRLYEFPTRVIDSLPSEKEQKVIETVINEKQKKSRLQKLFFKKNSPPSINIEQPVNHMCVVCLEAFKIGDQVRKLPCNHEYHCLCIDPWLTSKSSECPLCKFDCSDPKSMKEVPDPDGLVAAATVPGLKGMILRTYLRFKSKIRRHGQVNPTVETSNNNSNNNNNNSNSNYNTVDETAPPSPGFRAAVLAIESLEAQANQNTPVQQTTQVENAVEEDQTQRQSIDREGSKPNPKQSLEEDGQPSEEGAPQVQEYKENVTQMAQFDDGSNKEKKASLETQRNEQVNDMENTQMTHRDIDVASISLCSIDLSGFDVEFTK